MKTTAENRLIKPYIDIAQGTGIFSPKEIKIIEELLLDCRSSDGADYVIIDEYRDSRLVGFAVIERIEWTRFSWELYWIIVDKAFQRKGIGKRLLHNAEQYLVAAAHHSILVAELSTAKEYEPAHVFIIRTGFKKVGSIPGFFSHNDSLITYYKEIKI